MLLESGNKGHSSLVRRFDLSPFVYHATVRFRSDHMPLQHDFDVFTEIVFPSRDIFTDCSKMDISTSASFYIMGTNIKNT